MITFKELSSEGIPTDEDIKANLYRLHFCLNYIRVLWGKPMVVTSGLRTLAHHLEIYKKLGKPAPMGSLHLMGLAADISDPDGTLKKWTVKNLVTLEELGLYCEDFRVTNGWVHYQCLPPASGQRFFLP